MPTALSHTRAIEAVCADKKLKYTHQFTKCEGVFAQSIPQRQFISSFFLLLCDQFNSRAGNQSGITASTWIHLISLLHEKSNMLCIRQQLYNGLSISESHRISHSAIVKANKLRGAIRTVTLNDAVWLILLSVGCDNAKQTWTSKCCCRPWEAVTKPGWQAESNRRTPRNTKHQIQCQLTAHNRLSDFSQLQSQIQSHLGRFYQHLEVLGFVRTRGCPESRENFAFESEVSSRPPILISFRTQKS